MLLWRLLRLISFMNAGLRLLPTELLHRPAPHAVVLVRLVAQPLIPVKSRNTLQILRSERRELRDGTKKAGQGAVVLIQTLLVPKGVRIHKGSGLTSRFSFWCSALWDVGNATTPRDRCQAMITCVGVTLCFAAISPITESPRTVAYPIW